ncbi:MAG: hypothetical protein JST80_12860 [Bdellovibrionales bacterium]|nr:hypothetical protein [Bdellovibrionales bacterium]
MIVLGLRSNIRAKASGSAKNDQSVGCDIKGGEDGGYVILFNGVENTGEVHPEIDDAVDEMNDLLDTGSCSGSFAKDCNIVYDGSVKTYFLYRTSGTALSLSSDGFNSLGLASSFMGRMKTLGICK